MNKIKEELTELEKELRKERNYSAADKLVPIIERIKDEKENEITMFKLP